MSLPDNHLKREWIASGSMELWETEGTYSSVAYDRLPPVPNIDSKFEWMSKLQGHRYGSSLNNDENKVGNLEMLEDKLSSYGFSFPDDFLLFIEDSDIQERVPSCTDCYLSLSENVIPLPNYPDCFAVRFMNDSQCCVMWYLLFQPGFPIRVLASGHFIEKEIFDVMTYENDSDELLDYSEVLKDACICAESFREFIYRFCVENCLWFANYKNLCLSSFEKKYQEYVRATDKLTPSDTQLTTSTKSIKEETVEKFISKQYLTERLQKAAQIRSLATLLLSVPVSFLVFILFKGLLGENAVIVSFFGVPIIVMAALTKFYCEPSVRCPYCDISLWPCGTGNFKPRRIKIRKDSNKCPSCHAPIK